MVMADCIILSSDSEKCISDKDDDLPSFSAFLKTSRAIYSSKSSKTTVQSSRTVCLVDDETESGQSQTLTEEDEEELDLKVAKRRRLEKEKEERKMERERKKAEKQREKNVHKMVSQAEMESRKEAQPGHRVKQMVLQLETNVTECPKLMSSLLEQLQELEVQYRVDSSLPPYCVTWKRKNTTRSLNEELAKVIQNVQEVDEDFLCVVVSGSYFVDLVSSSKSMDQTGHSDGKTLLQFVESFLKSWHSKNIVILVNDIEAALRAQKTQRDRIFRAAVRSNKAASLNKDEVLSYFDCENVMVGLQLETGCSVRLCSSSEQIAELIVTYTKALADRPFKKDDAFSFHGDLGPGATRKALKETDNKTGLIWQHQLLQYPGISNPIASAIVNQYPSPSHLLKAYSNCSSVQEAESLLEDIQVRRGAGVVASTRRVGGSISKRIHFAMTCKQGSELLPN